MGGSRNHCIHRAVKPFVGALQEGFAGGVGLFAAFLLGGFADSLHTWCGWNVFDGLFAGGGGAKSLHFMFCGRNIRCIYGAVKCFERTVCKGAAGWGFV
jgi:hypothetical protein